MAFYRNEYGLPKRTSRPNRNVRRLHLQSQVAHGKALPREKEQSVRRRLAKLLKLEGLTGRRYDRLVNKSKRKVS